VARQLGGRRSRTDGGTEVDRQFVGGLSRLGKVLGANHPTDTDIDLVEISEADLRADLHGAAAYPIDPMC
jgi:hypothetical protein